MTALQATTPERARDEVRLMVAQGERLIHTDFLDLPNHLRAGDLLIVNASATIPAALPARRSDGSAVDLHLSTPDPTHADRWVVELRRDGRRARGRAEVLQLPGTATATLLAPYLSPGRLWVARLHLPAPLHEYLHAHGAPITYAHDLQMRPLEDYQTIFATEPGSAEMPSAGRPFTKRAMLGLREHGIRVQRITLHTGVSSQERGERPYPERYRVPEHTARRINATRAAGGRIIAVGTTVVRALETVAAPGREPPCRRWLDEPRRDAGARRARRRRPADGLARARREPPADARGDRRQTAARALLRRRAGPLGYRWHEFGDLHLIMR